MSNSVQSHIDPQSNWKYEFKSPDSFSIQPYPPIETPKTLAKYYGLNKYSIDAIKKQYLYASSQFSLNDPFDCMNNLISMECVPIEEILAFHSISKPNQSFRPEEILKLRKDFQWHLPSLLLDKFGVVSLTENHRNVPMWAHYASNHEGFAVRLKIGSMSKRLVGPFPINYVKSWTPIDFNKGMGVSFLFMSNIKSFKWKYENEWRFIGLGNDMAIPKIKDKPNLVENRKFGYSIKDIEEIVFGWSFFNDIWYHNKNGSFIIKIDISTQSHRLKLALLDFVTKNKTNISRMDLKNYSNEFIMEPRSIQIEKTDCFDFLLSYKHPS